MSMSVYFFGGYLASQVNMDVWLASARTQKAYVDFTAYKWFDDKKESKCIAAIKASDADFIWIVGHSSGCANANAVEEAFAKDTSRIVLVALDGFSPNKKQRDRTSTEIWSAKNGTFIARNYQALKNSLGHELQEYTARPDCTTKWALHFSMVNENASDSVVKAGNELATGYDQCKANLCFLP